MHFIPELDNRNSTLIDVFPDELNIYVRIAMSEKGYLMRTR